MVITIRWRDAQRKARSSKHEVQDAVWDAPNFNRDSYVRGCCQVLGGRFIRYEETNETTSNAPSETQQNN